MILPHKIVLFRFNVWLLGHANNFPLERCQILKLELIQLILLNELLLIKHEWQANLLELCLHLKHIIIDDLFNAGSLPCFFLEHLVNKIDKFHAHLVGYLLHLLC